MAFEGNPEHLAKLKEGVDAWNNWRDAENVFPDLSGANLRRIHLAGANLSGSIYLNRANLRGAQLSGADLHEAYLVEANLRTAYLVEANLRTAYLIEANLGEAILTRADLSGAFLSKANLAGANLSGVDLRGADLSKANLRGVLLRHVNLSGANLAKSDVSEAKFYETVFANVDLSETIGLETCDHQGPSTIDDRTLQKSKNLSIDFLRGVGLSDDRIRAYLYGTSITVEFTEQGWGDLIPIEKALKAVLGEGYEVIKGHDRITVKLASPNLINQTLDAVGAVFSALESESRGEVSALKVQTSGSDEETLRHKEVMFTLSQLIKRFDTQYKPESIVEETGKGILEGLPGVGPLIMRWIEWVHAKVQKPDQEEERLQEIYSRYKFGFEGLLGIRALPAKEQKQLPPAEVEDEDG